MQALHGILVAATIEHNHPVAGDNRAAVPFANFPFPDERGPFFRPRTDQPGFAGNAVPRRPEKLRPIGSSEQWAVSSGQ